MRIAIPIALALASACKPDPTGQPPAAEGPEVLAAELLRPAPDVAPLLWRVELEADRPVSLVVRWTDGEHEVSVAFDDAPSELHARHLVGFRAGRTYTVTATATDEEGRETVVPLGEIAAEAAPAYFPIPELVVNDPAARSPGHTLLPLHSAMSGAPGPVDVTAVYDEEGHLCYWLQGDAVYQALVDRGAGAPLFGLVGEGEDAIVGETLWTGEWVRWWSPVATSAPGVQLDAPRDLGTFHHDAVPLADGDVLAVARVGLDVPAYPTDYVDPGTAPAKISDDVFVRFAPDGTVESVATTSQLLPVQRIGYGSLDRNNADLFDWAHANAILEDPTDGGVIVSLRHQDAVIKFRWNGAGQPVLDWILGNHENWPDEWEPFLLAPQGPLEWPFHQHGPEIVSTSADAITLVLFDNGNYRAVPYGSEPPKPSGQYSRVVQYTVRPGARTVTEDWAFVDTSVGTLFSGAVGNADLQPNGNVVANYGFVQGLGGAANGELGLGAQAIRVIEFDPDTLGEVWHLSLATEAADNPSGWTAYRAHRIPSLYGRVID